MSKCFKQLFAVQILLAFLANPVLATKPGATLNPNGFPKGFHYNLNIHAKGENFVCDYSRDELGQIVDGNVINVPDYVEKVGIRMLSGKGKKAAEFTELRVTDPCAGFPPDKDLTDDPDALLQLPKNEYGYKVYGRPLGKPSKGSETRNIAILPGLSQVWMEERDADGNLILDENGEPLLTELVYLGEFAAKDGKSFERKKGRSVASSLNDLFEWTGEVCYFDSTGYCDGDCVAQAVCCETETRIVNDVSMDFYVNCDYAVMADTVLTCPLAVPPLALVPVECKTYSSGVWIFNIADLVEYLWQVSSNVKQFNVRFYPKSE